MTKLFLVFCLILNLAISAGCEKNNDMIVVDSIVRQSNIIPAESDGYIRLLPETIPTASIDVPKNLKSSLELFLLEDGTSEIPLFDKIADSELANKLANPTDYYRLKGISPAESFYPGWIWLKLHNKTNKAVDIGKLTYKGIISDYKVSAMKALVKNRFANAQFCGNLKGILTRWSKAGVDVKQLMRDKLICDGIPFKISTGEGSGQSYFSFQSPGIFYKLHFLHSVANANAGTRLGYYKIVYADGSAERINLIAGLNIHELTGRYGQGGSPAGSSDCPYAKIAWRKDKTNSAGNVSVYHTEWINRYPEIPIKKIEIYADSTGRTSLALLAVTGETFTDANAIDVKIVPKRYIVKHGQDFDFTVLVSNNIDKTIDKTCLITLRRGTVGDTVTEKKISITLAPMQTIAVKMHIRTNKLTDGVYSIKIENDKIDFVIFDELKSRGKPYYVMCIGADKATEWNLKKIKRYGFDIIYVQPKWKDIEQQKGIYKFDELQRVLDEADNIGLKVLIGVQSWATADYGGNYGVPKWINGRMKSRTGKVVTDATIWDEQYVTGLCELWENIANKFKDHPALAGYVPTGPGNDHMLNFGGGIYRDREFFDYSDYAQRAWKKYIKRDIPLPYSRSKTTAEIWRRFMEFRRDKVLDTWDRFCASIRKADKRKDIYLKQSGGWIVWGELQGSYFDGMLNLCKKWKGVLLKTGSEWTDQFLVMNGALARPMGIRSAAEMAILPPPKEAFYLGAFNMMAYSCEGAVYVIWDVGQPICNWTIMKPAWQNILNADHIEDNVCLIYSTYSSTALGLITDKQVDDIRSNTMSWGYMCATNGILNAACTDRQLERDLSGYDIIVDANSPTHPPTYWEKLKRYAESGGTLILPFKTGQAEKYEFLKKWLTVMPIKGKFESVKSCNSKITLPALGNNIRGLRFESSKRKFKTLAMWNDNSPAIVEIRTGKGRVIWIGVPLVHHFFKSDYRDSIESILRYAGLKRHCRIDSPKIQPYLFIDEQHKQIFILAYNNSAEPVNAITRISNCLPFSSLNQPKRKLICENMITGEHKTITLTGKTIRVSLTYQPLMPTIVKITPMLKSSSVLPERQ